MDTRHDRGRAVAVKWAIGNSNLTAWGKAVVVLGCDAAQAALEPLYAEFEAAHPEVEVKRGEAARLQRKILRRKGEPGDEDRAAALVAECEAIEEAWGLERRKEEILMALLKPHMGAL